MKKQNLFYSLIILLHFTFPLQAWWWSTKQPQTLETTIQDLQQKQADHPNDPYINYNLGVALYKAGKFSQAQTNFDRALVAATHPELKKRCYFNIGNSFYKDAATSLPDNWETVQVPAETLDMAIAKASIAIKKYDSVLLLDKQHKPAQINQKAAKDLLEQLEKKKHQQEKDKKDQKHDKNKDKDQQKDQSKSQGQNENNQPQDNKGQKSPQAKDQGDKNKQQGNNNQPQNEPGKDKQQQPAPTQPNPAAGKTDKQEGNPTPGAPQPAGVNGSRPERMEQRAARALLDNLQQDESKLQKALVVKQLKDNEKPRESSQRPW
jgi:hypothetical protein